MRSNRFLSTSAALILGLLAGMASAQEPPDGEELSAGMTARLTDIRSGLVTYTISATRPAQPGLEDPEEFKREVETHSNLVLGRLGDRAIMAGGTRDKVQLRPEDTERIVTQVTRAKLGCFHTEKRLYAWSQGKIRSERERFYDPDRYYKPQSRHIRSWSVDDTRLRMEFSDLSGGESPHGNVAWSEKTGYEIPRHDQPLRWPTMHYGGNITDMDFEVESREVRFDHTCWWLRVERGQSTYRVLVCPELSHMTLEHQVLRDDGSVRSKAEVKSLTESNGVSFPALVVNSWFNEDGSVALEELTEVTELALNVPPDDSLFTAVFPNGTRVNDSTVSPTATRVIGEAPAGAEEMLLETAAELAAAEPEARVQDEAEAPEGEPAGTPPPPPAGTAAVDEGAPLTYLPAALLAGAVVLAAIALLAIKRRRSSG